MASQGPLYCSQRRDPACPFFTFHKHGMVTQRISFRVISAQKLEFHYKKGKIIRYYSIDRDSVGNHSATILAAVIISVVLAAGFAGALICRITRRRSLMRNRQMFSAINLTRTSVITTGNTRKNILLLWLRDNSQLTQQVDQLKNKFKGLNAKVIFITFIFSSLSVY